MGFRAEVRDFIKKQDVKDSTEHIYQKTIALLMSEIVDLRKLNKDLMDRLMARSFEELKVYQTEEETISLTASDLQPENDEGNVGEII